MKNDLIGGKESAAAPAPEPVEENPDNPTHDYTVERLAHKATQAALKDATDRLEVAKQMGFPMGAGIHKGT